ncbi:Histone-lysine N-methyltransferase SETMAR [Eumeta japonica]|uniref:Histone-lysine N-methyltransferase SETMAR n=1 Tax=Eumeta variegata TaxID=151549 RepID=A0A4C1XD84_EUMVA|nr:Histone-lysine N-methyltransferase SETMAR [Eumeta japonica]
MKPGFVNTIRNLNRSPCNGRKRRKAAEIQGSKVGIEGYGDNFWDSEGAVLQDNASVHTARVSRQALKDTGFSEIDHPPYSPDLAPSDYFLFQFKTSYVVEDLLMTIK